jgi:hypothetical protein
MRCNVSWIEEGGPENVVIEFVVVDDDDRPKSLPNHSTAYHDVWVKASMLLLLSLLLLDFSFGFFESGSLDDDPYRADS